MLTDVGEAFCRVGRIEGYISKPCFETGEHRRDQCGLALHHDAQAVTAAEAFAAQVMRHLVGLGIERGIIQALPLHHKGFARCICCCGIFKQAAEYRSLREAELSAFLPLCGQQCFCGFRRKAAH